MTQSPGSCNDEWVVVSKEGGEDKWFQWYRLWINWMVKSWSLRADQGDDSMAHLSTSGADTDGVAGGTVIEWFVFGFFRFKCTL